MNAEIGTAHALVVAEPEHQKPVTFCVTLRRFGRCERYVTHLKGSDGYFTKHTSFEAAVRSVLYRARRFERAYSRPRGVAS